MHQGFIDLSKGSTGSSELILKIFFFKFELIKMCSVTEANVGLMVYLVNLGFVVDSPSSCIVNTTPIIAAETKVNFFYSNLKIIFDVELLTH